MAAFPESVFLAKMGDGKGWNFCYGERAFLTAFGVVFLYLRKKKMVEINDGLAQTQTLDRFEIPFLKEVFFWENQWKAPYLSFFFFNEDCPCEFATLTLAKFVASSTFPILWVANSSKYYSAVLCLRC